MPAAAVVIGKDSGTEIMQTRMHFIELREQRESFSCNPRFTNHFCFYISNISEERKHQASIMIERRPILLYPLIRSSPFHPILHPRRSKQSP